MGIIHQIYTFSGVARRRKVGGHKLFSQKVKSKKKKKKKKKKVTAALKRNIEYGG